MEHCHASQDSDGCLWTNDWGSLDQPLIDSDEELTSDNVLFPEFLRTMRRSAGSSHDEGFTDDLDWSQDASQDASIDQKLPLIRSSPCPDLMTYPPDEDYLVTMLPDGGAFNGREIAIEVDRWCPDGVLSRAPTPLLSPIGISDDKGFYYLDSDIEIPHEQAALDDVFMQEDSSDEWNRESDEELIFTFADSDDVE